MNSRDLFGVAVRVCGLIFIFLAINRLSGVFENVSWSFTVSEIELKDLQMAFLAACIECVFLREADVIVRFAYPERTQQEIEKAHKST